MTVKEKETSRCDIIDMAILSDYIIQKKTTEKMIKYIDLQIECQKMWKKKVRVIPTGIIDRNIKSYIGKISGSHNIYNLQRSAILGTTHIPRKVLSLKPE